MTAGEYMKHARKRAGWTLKQLEKASGIKEPCISRYENDLTYPTLATLELLADALGISIDEYVGHKVIGESKLTREVLTPRQAEWAYQRWCEGYTPILIAEALKVDPSTVHRALRDKPRVRPVLVYDEE